MSQTHGCIIWCNARVMTMDTNKLLSTETSDNDNNISNSRKHIIYFVVPFRFCTVKLPTLLHIYKIPVVLKIQTLANYIINVVPRMKIVEWVIKHGEHSSRPEIVVI